MDLEAEQFPTRCLLMATAQCCCFLSTPTLIPSWTQLTHGPWGARRAWGPRGSLGPVAASLGEGIRQKWISWQGEESE